MKLRITAINLILAEDRSEIARKAALETLTDQTQLAKIALGDKSEAVRLAAVAKPDRGIPEDARTDSWHSEFRRRT